MIISENTSDGKSPVHIIQTYGRGEGTEIQLHSFLTSAIDGGECFGIKSRPEDNPCAIEYEVEQKTQ
jgi:hypothetical protein